ncbi:unnamed protein product [Oncorhynchus mykiss]|uniref:SSD domain-containing protein n=1 Tax=Oncorhynchus mykiss TaxID=8022 RepID=A0A060WJ04_ONCMY|nr:unnamed protein product [Oncorhynchus mykiss]
MLDIINGTASTIKKANLTFPYHNSTSNTIFLGTELGGVVLNSSIIVSAKAVRLFYFLRENNEAENDNWLHGFTQVFSNLSDELNKRQIQVSYFTSNSREEEFKENSKSVIPLFSVTYFLAISFSIISCLRLDCVRNKVWVAIFGALSAGLAVLSSFGLLLLCGMPFAMTVATAPFLILGQVYYQNPLDSNLNNPLPNLT